MNVNEHLVTNANALRLITDFEGAPRLKARLCEGGRYELSYGVTFHIDGSPVLEGETCTEEGAMAMFRHALKVFEDIVRKHVIVPLNGNQFGALVAFGYNVGEANFASSTVLRMVNELRFEDAAAAFGMWVFATKDGYKQALRGLLRREYATACLFLSYDWTEACADEAVALQRQKPDKLPGADRVLYKTPFANILRVAQQHPLPAEPIVTVIIDKPAEMPEPINSELILVDQLPQPSTEVKAEVGAGLSDSQSATQPIGNPEPASHVNETPISQHEEGVVLKTSTQESAASPSGGSDVTVVPQSPSVTTASGGPALESKASASVAPKKEALPPPAPIIIAPKQIDPKSADYGAVDIEKGAKNMTDSRRFVGMLIVGLGSLIQVLAARNVVTSLFGAIFFDLSRDPVILALMAGAVIWFIGLFTKKRGGKVMTTGFVEAEQLLK